VDVLGYDDILKRIDRNTVSSLYSQFRQGREGEILQGIVRICRHHIVVTYIHGQASFICKKFGPLLSVFSRVDFKGNNMTVIPSAARANALAPTH